MRYLLGFAAAMGVAFLIYLLGGRVDSFSGGWLSCLAYMAVQSAYWCKKVKTIAGK